MSREIKYIIAATSALSGFQLIEFALKVYIAGSYNVIKIFVRNEVPFNYSFADIQSASLEKLLGVFSKLNNNLDLQSRLNKLKDSRNHLAHSALLAQHDGLNRFLGIDLEEHHADVAATKAEIDSCLYLLQIELANMLQVYGRVAP